MNLFSYAITSDTLVSYPVQGNSGGNHDDVHNFVLKKILHQQIDVFFFFLSDLK